MGTHKLENTSTHAFVGNNEMVLNMCNYVALPAMIAFMTMKYNLKLLTHNFTSTESSALCCFVSQKSSK